MYGISTTTISVISAETPIKSTASCFPFSSGLKQYYSIATAVCVCTKSYAEVEYVQIGHTIAVTRVCFRWFRIGVLCPPL